MLPRFTNLIANGILMRGQYSYITISRRFIWLTIIAMSLIIRVNNNNNNNLFFSV